MKHEVTVYPTSAECSCGYSCVALTPGAPAVWKEQHLREFADTCEVSGVKLTATKRLLEFATDEQLREECERRFAGPVNEYTRLLGEHQKLMAERAAIDHERHSRAHALALAERERDEWKRRAEAAETALHFLDQRPAFIMTGVDPGPVRVGSANVGRERGPGIATQRPDNSIAFLDEDLLCEDA